MISEPTIPTHLHQAWAQPALSAAGVHQPSSDLLPPLLLSISNFIPVRCSCQPGFKPGILHLALGVAVQFQNSATLVSCYF